ncbi:calcium-binding protein [Acinetobacter rathckeae]|uniref:calcium-binding protein n=1 Tax=Acinetobacter rathckeae TaxID=2605272 RepID=UPI002B1BD2A7|nr:calcium-binding protein [Acinetobacter rathckeae]
MSQISIKEILSLYLFGQKEIPSNLKDDKWLRDKDAKGQLDHPIDMVEFMTQGAGRYIQPGAFLAVTKFLEGKYSEKLTIGQSYSFNELLTKVVVIDKNSEKYTAFKAEFIKKNPSASENVIDNEYKVAQGILGLTNYNLDIDSSDYLQRSYVFGSMQFTLSDDTKFIIDESGQPRIENLRVVPIDDNFDYESRDGLAGKTNRITEPFIDPFKIGRQVELKYDQSTKDRLQAYDLTSANLPTLHAQKKELDNLKSSIFGITDRPNIIALINGLDEIISIVNAIYRKDNKLIVYGSKQDDLDIQSKIDKYLKNLPPIELSSSTYVAAYAVSIFPELDKQKEFVQNSGRIYVLGDGNDTITATDKDDIIYGGAGHDTIYGGHGNDLIYGGTGNDQLYGDQGNDLIVGGDGNIQIDAGDGNDVVAVLSQSYSKAEVKGGKGNDVITVTDGENTLEGNEGNDHIEGGKGKDRIDGGAGNDYIQGHDGENELKGGEGNDYLVGGKDKDILEGNKGTNVLDGKEGEDIYRFHSTDLSTATTLIADQDGTLEIDGKPIEVGNYDEEISAWRSIDKQYIINKIQGDSNQYTIVIFKEGELKNNIYLSKWRKNGDLGLTFSNAPSIENAPQENNSGPEGNNFVNPPKDLLGGEGDDVIVANSYEAAVAFGGNGSDFIMGSSIEDKIYGGNGNDYIWGGLGKDKIYGGNGDDVILSANSNKERGANRASFFWETHYERAEFISSNPKQEEKKEEEISKIFDQLYKYDNNYQWDMSLKYYKEFDEKSESYSYFMNGTPYLMPILKPYIQSGDNRLKLSDTFDSFDEKGIGEKGADIVYGGAGDDFIIGSSDNDHLYGGDDKDYLYGLAGNDHLYGGKGEDEISGGIGQDYIFGGEGNDRISGDYDSDIIYGGAGDDKINGDVINLLGTDAPPNGTDISRFGNDLIYGGSGEDSIYGNNGDDFLYGGDDNDKVNGNEGNDFVYGDNGNDNLWGEDGDDYLFGGNGNDLAYGGKGEDFIFGDEGDDSLFGNEGNDLIYGGTGSDMLFGDEGDDIIYGGEGADRIYGGAGDDIIDGGKGNDILTGGKGSDLYTFSIGDGQDIIQEEVSDIASLNTKNYILFKFDPSQVRGVSRQNDVDLVVQYGENDQITVKNYYKISNKSNHSYLENTEKFEQIEISEIRFVNGPVWNTADIMAMAPPPEHLEDIKTGRDDLPYFINALATEEYIKVKGKNTVTYGFFFDEKLSNSKNFFQQQKDAVTLALKEYSRITNIEFEQVTELSDKVDFKFYLDDLTSAEAGAAAGYASAQTGEIHLNSNIYKEASSFNQGEYGFEVLLHEIGHALGLEHPFEAPVLPEKENNQNNTIMSYTSNQKNDVTLGMYDIAAIHYLHGIRSDLKPEDNIYEFDTNYIYDGAGIDTLSATSQIKPVHLDLNQGGWSYVGEKSESILDKDQLVIGYGTEIENAIGSSESDTILGNQLNNTLTGGLGNDTYIFNEKFGHDKIIENDFNNIIKLNFELVEDFAYYYEGKLHHGENTVEFDLKNFSKIVIQEKEISVDEFKKKFFMENVQTSMTLNAAYKGAYLSNTEVTFYGNENSNLIYGTKEQEIHLFNGNNKVSLNGGDNKVYTGNGNNYIEVGQGQNYIRTGSGDDVITTKDGDQKIQAGDGDNQVTVGTGNSEIIAGSGSDIITTQAGNHIITGGKGNDMLNSKNNKSNLNTYIFQQGDGQDTISTEGQIKLVLKDTLWENASFIIQNDDLIIKYGENNSEIKVQGFKQNSNINIVEFKNASWSAIDLDKHLKQILTGTDQNDYLYNKTKYITDIWGLDGNDSLSGRKLDTLYGGNGDDHLIATEDGVNLYGGKGNDTYTFKDGAKNTIIRDEDLTGTIELNFAPFYTVQTGDHSNDNIYPKQGRLIDQGKFDTVYAVNSDTKRNTTVNFNSKNKKIEVSLEQDSSGITVSYSLRAETKYTVKDVVFSIENIEQIDSLKNFKVSVINPKGFYNTYDFSGTNSYTRKFIDTVITMDEFLNQGTVKQTYGSEDDVIKGVSTYYYEGDIIYAGAGNDQVDTGLGGSTVYGEDGDDLIVTPDINAHDTVYGGEGNDIIYTFNSVIEKDKNNKYSTSDEIYGGNGNDRIYVGNQWSRIYGGQGDDTLIGGNDGGYLDGGEGADYLQGGLGNDTYVIDEWDTVRLDLEQENGGYDKVITENNLDTTGLYIEEVELIGQKNSQVTGNQLDNKILGNSGNNQLYGGEGNDTLYGGDGNDYLDGGEGNDILYGGEGSDYYVMKNFDHIAKDEMGNLKVVYGDKVIENGQTGIDTLELWGDLILINPYDLSSEDRTYTYIPDGIENIILKGDAKTVFGNNLDNEFWLNSNNNNIYAGKGKNTVHYANGSNKDTITFDTSTQQKNTLLIEGYFLNNIKANKVGNDLKLSFGSDSNDEITLRNYFKENAADFIHIELSEGNHVISKEWINHSILELRGDKNNNNLFGSGLNETIYGYEGNDYLDGGEGNDTLYGGSGDDTLYGGLGNDILDGGTGDDKYVYRLGDGQDIINQTGGGKDIVLFTNGITKDRLSFTKDTNDLVVLVDKDPQQSVRIKDHFLSGEKAIAMVQPDGGYAILASDIAKQFKTTDTTPVTPPTPQNPQPTTPVVPTPKPSANGYDKVITGTNSQGEQLVGTSGKDLIQGSTGNDYLYGFSGDDYLDGGDGDDYLSGGNGIDKNTGNDTLVGGAGNDILAGEDGDDLLIGGTGNDSYLYSEHNGVDTIDNTGGGNDGVFFMNVKANRLSYHQDKNDLVILIDKDLKQQVRIKEHFLGNDKAISYIQPEDGYSIMATQIPKLLTTLPGQVSTTPIQPIIPSKNKIVGTVKNDAKLQGTAKADLIQGLAGNDKLYGMAGDDELEGGDGNDLLDGGEGNDLLDGGKGNDTLFGGKGNDTYLFNKGFGQDIINNVGGGNDQIYFNGINYNEVMFSVVKNNLLIKIKNTKDQITVQNWLKGGENIVPTVKFSSGDQIASAQIFKAIGKTDPTVANNLNAMKNAMATSSNTGASSLLISSPSTHGATTLLASNS